MMSRYENILFIAVIGVCSNLLCISTLSNELPSSGLGFQGKHDTSKTMALKQMKFGPRVLSSLDKLAMLNHNEKMNAVGASPNSEGDYRKNLMTSNQNYILHQPRILIPAPPPPPPSSSSYNHKNFNKITTKPFIGNKIFNDDDDVDDNDDIDDDDDADEDIEDDENDVHDDSDYNDETNSDNILQQLVDDIKVEKEIALKSSGLLKLLLDIPTGPLPVIYIEETDIPQIPYYGLVKRGGRYNQRYPWKRENSLYRRESIHPETRFHCIPSREEVFRLLIGLHENRSGHQPKTVRFCNRRRPARSILTSIRFMG